MAHFSVSTYIGLRYARSSKSNHFIAFINFFSVAGICLGIAALVTVLSVMNGLEGQLKQRILGILPHIVVTTNDADMQEKILALPQVTAISQQIESEGVIQSRRELSGIILQGVEPEQIQAHSIIAKNMLLGDIRNLQSGSYGIIIGRALSQRLGLYVGDKTRLLSAEASVYTPMGRVPSQRLFEVTGIFDVGSDMDDKVVLVHIHDAAKLMRKKTQQIARTRLFLDDAFAYAEVETELNKLALQSDNWRSRQGPLFDAVKMEKNMMGLMLLLIIAVAAFNIVSALVMLVTEKRSDIAILQTQGMNTSQILFIFLFNGFYNGLKGTVLGTALGLLLVYQLNNLLTLLGVNLNFGEQGQGLPIDLQWSQLLIVVSLSLSLCMLATLYPAFRASRVEPAKALKYE